MSQTGFKIGRVLSSSLAPGILESSWKVGLEINFILHLFVICFSGNQNIWNSIKGAVKCKRDFKWPSLQKWQCPIRNGTCESCVCYIVYKFKKRIFSMVVSQKTDFTFLQQENPFEWKIFTILNLEKRQCLPLYFKGTVASGPLKHCLKPDLSCEPTKEKWCCIRSLSCPRILEPSILHPGQDFSIYTYY